jgi:hypothetical protein
MTDPARIFLPVLAVVAITLIGFLKLLVERSRTAKLQHPDFYRAHVGDPEPERTRAAARHWDNLFELPTLFYAGCLTAYVLAAVTPGVVACAWAFAIARTAQSAVHLTYNNPAHRGSAFLVTVVAIMLMWTLIAPAVLVRL